MQLSGGGSSFPGVSGPPENKQMERATMIMTENHFILGERCIEFLIPQRSERSGSSILVPLPSECRESKVRYPAPWGAKEAKPTGSRACPGGIDTFHFSYSVIAMKHVRWNKQVEVAVDIMHKQGIFNPPHHRLSRA
jgi:hypothetical protein